MTLSRFLLSGAPPRLEWVLLGAARTLRMGVQEVPLFQLGPQGAILLDPKQRKLVRRGPSQIFAPGLRASDLVGQPLALVEPSPEGGLRLVRELRSEPLARGLVAEPLALCNWLTPAPPRPDALRFTDQRIPPKGLLPGLSEMRRELRLDPKAKPGGPRRYLVEGSARIVEASKAGSSPAKRDPMGAMAAMGSGAAVGKAKAGKEGNSGGDKAGGAQAGGKTLVLRLEGEVEVGSAEARLPALARLRLIGALPGKPPVREIVFELKALGQGCNR